MVSSISARKVKSQSHQHVSGWWEQIYFPQYGGGAPERVPTVAGLVVSKNENGEAAFPCASPISFGRPALPSAPMICVRF